MARGHGRILSSIWDDPDFLRLPCAEQRMYCFLLSQANLNHAGLLPVTLRRWSRKASDLTVDAVEDCLRGLMAARFVVVDTDTEELLVRSLIRNDGVYKQPKVMAAAVSGAQEISSPLLRRVLLAEVERIPLEELNDEPGARGPSVRQQIAGHIATLRKTLAVPDPTPPGSPSDTPAEGYREPFPKPSGEGSGTPGEDEGEPSTRARAGTSRAHSPAPAPAPAPAHYPTTAYGRADEPPAPAAEVVDAELVTDRPGTELALAAPATAQTLVAEWIDHQKQRPPGRVIGHVSRELKSMLDEGLDPDAVRAGLAQWARRGLNPSALPSVVHEVMTRGTHTGSRQQQETDDMFARAAARAAARMHAQEAS